MKYLTTLLGWLFALGVNAQISRHNALIDGQNAYEKQDFGVAYDYWKSAESESSELDVQSQFNIGLALYQQEKYDESITTWSGLTDHIQNKTLRSELFQNLGNAYGKKEQWEKAVKAYRQALRNNSKNDEARYGLSQALRKLKKQEQEKNQKGDQNKDEKDSEKGNQQNQEGGNQDQKNNDQNGNQQNQEGDSQNQNDQQKGDQSSDQSQAGDGEESNQEENRGEGAKAEDQEGQEERGNMIKRIPEKEAQMLLEAIAKQEKATNNKMNKKKMKGKAVKTDKDW